MNARHLEQGALSEQAAENYLASRGLEVLERNFRSRCGEIDLVMMDGKDLVFVEVRYRRSADFGGALESITRAKINRIRRTAEAFLAARPRLEFVNCRFDVVLATPGADGGRLEWIPNAFE